jgi:23S rRNA (adenine2503-C2)-methyltransferase
VSDFEQMHDLPRPLREALQAEYRLFGSEIVRHQVSTDGTEKLLFSLADGENVECVLMREEDRRTVCVSTQVGCGMGCVFCASGLMGVKRNLSTGEILDQILRIDRLLADDERITNVVVMGMGEPLANLKALLPALDTLNEKGGLGLGARRITVSTVGLPDRMRELAGHGVPYNLAVSLHAPNDDLRTRIVPVNRNTGIADILAAADEYFERTGRRVTYEYVLLGGINDAPEHARELASLLRRRNAHVNLIPMNPVAPLDLHAPEQPRSATFAELLERGGVNVTVRKRKGADIDAACGQLRLAELKAPNETCIGR